jgi:hypothetical protein
MTKPIRARVEGVSEKLRESLDGEARSVDNVASLLFRFFAKRNRDCVVRSREVLSEVREPFTEVFRVRKYHVTVRIDRRTGLILDWRVGLKPPDEDRFDVRRKG